MAAPAFINCIFIGDLISVQTVLGPTGEAKGVAEGRENLQLSWGGKASSQDSRRRCDTAHQLHDHTCGAAHRVEGTQSRGGAATRLSFSGRATEGRTFRIILLAPPVDVEAQLIASPGAATAFPCLYILEAGAPLDLRKLIDQ